MEWYWWLLIAVGVVVVAYLKIKVGGAFLRRMNERQKAAQQRMEDGD